MIRYVIRRLLWVALVMLVITFLSYVIFFVMPSVDPAIAFAGKAPTPRIINELREQFGLDKPFYAQYGIFVKNLFLGDEYGWPGFGFSYNTRSPIREEIFSRVWVTFQLAVGAALIWLTLGVSIGIASAIKRGSLVDRGAMGFALFGVSAPVFWLGLMGLWIFWEILDVLPSAGYVALNESVGQWLWHFILPWVVLSLLYAAFYARMVRGNLLETMSEDYIRTARAKGLSERKVVYKHGLRSSLTPIVTMFGMDVGLLLGGAVITETVFNLPGLGAYVVRSVFDGDLPATMAVVVLAALFVTTLNLIVDVVYAYLDPRVRYS